MGILLSIVVPVYNSKETICDLLDSILVSKSKQIEIIIVDDGSDDGSLEICKNYSERDNRIKVFHKKNGGVSSARNKGILESCGKYIYFCDSDDYVFANTIDENIAVLNYNYDIIIFDFITYDLVNKKKNECSLSLNSNYVLDKRYIIDNVIKPLVLKKGTGLAALWHKIFKMKLIADNELHFDENVNKGEDWRFILDYLYLTTTACYIPKNIYEYRVDGTQNDNKYKTAKGMSALGSIKRKLLFNDIFSLNADFSTVLSWYSQLIEQVIISVREKCEITELKRMINDSDVQTAADIILNADSKRLIVIEIPRRYKLYSFFIKHHLLRCFNLAIKLLGA